MAERTDVHLYGMVETIEQLSKVVDLAWQEVCRTGGPVDLVMAIDEASLGLQRARIALKGAFAEPTNRARSADPSPVLAGPKLFGSRTTSGPGQLVDAATG
jgi:hypothetical protein